MTVQKTILQIYNQIAGEINAPQQVVVVSSQTQQVQKVLSLMRGAKDDLKAEFDWQALQVRYPVTTVSGQEAYPYPSDVDRPINQTFFDTTNRWQMRGPLNPTQWEALKTTQLAASPWTNFRIQGNKMLIYPLPGSSAITYVYEYISTNDVIDGTGGANKQDFTQDSDMPIYDFRLMVYLTKLKWLASNGLDTTAALIEYQRALDFAKAHDVPAQVISMNASRRTNLISTDQYRDGNWVI